jgi:hypothetical protein
MAIVCEFRITAWFCGSPLNPITSDYRGALVRATTDPLQTSVEGAGRALAIVIQFGQ